MSIEAIQANSFSVGQARHLVKDLFEPNPTIYWADFLLSVTVGFGCYAAIERFSLPPTVLVACFVVSCIALYRASLFTHELTHLRPAGFQMFRVAWNALFGIWALMPSFTYYSHVVHHTRKHYGTRDDGEYLPLGRGSVWSIVGYLAQSFFIPLLVFARFLILTPCAWLVPGLRRWVDRHASSMIMDPTYVRPLPTTREIKLWRFQEAVCFVVALSMVIVFALGIRGLSTLVHIYLTAFFIVLVNALRTMVAHRYLNEDGEMTFVAQLVDSFNYPRNWFVSEFWAPVGLRFHALHHLFPSLPYHNLGKAHRRLMQDLPADSPYRLTESAGFWASARVLLQNVSQRHDQTETTYDVPQSRAA